MPKIAALLNPARLFVLFLAAQCPACSSGPRLEPVEGKVLHKGKELKGVVVFLHPKGADPVTAIRPTGMTKEDGTFIIMTGNRTGAPAGEYTVTFTCPKEVEAKDKKKTLDMNMSKETFDFFDSAYADVSKSAFKIEVKAGGSKLEPFRLD